MRVPVCVLVLFLLLVASIQLAAGVLVKSHTGPSKYARYGLIRSKEAYTPLM